MEPEIGHARALDLLLNRENPRHEPKQNQPEIIEHLLNDEQVDNLARHISEHGLNPLEIVAVFPDQEGNLIVAEGNRRICALQLLLDPQKAPPERRNRFGRLAKNGNFPESILVAKFDLYEEARPWLDVLHDGGQDGIGRRTWGAEQKARNTQKTSRHTLTLRLVDHALAKGLLAKEDKPDLTTMTRYLENPRVRQAMGIATTPSDPNVQITIAEELFDKILIRFVEDADNGRIHSRSKGEDWRAYANTLEAEFQTPQNQGQLRSVGGAPTPAQPAAAAASTKRAMLRRTRDDRIRASEAIVLELNRLNSAKLISIYRSLTTLSLTDHSALLTAGAWIFLESLTALHGRNESSSFESYIQGKLNLWAVDRNVKKEAGLSLAYISNHGNAEKHSAIFSSVDAKNLRNHFGVLDRVLTRLIQECPR